MESVNTKGHTHYLLICHVSMHTLLHTSKVTSFITTHDTHTMVVYAYIIRSSASLVGQSAHHPFKPNGALLLLTQPKHTLQREREDGGGGVSMNTLMLTPQLAQCEHNVMLLVPSPHRYPCRTALCNLVSNVHF